MTAELTAIKDHRRPPISREQIIRLRRGSGVASANAREFAMTDIERTGVIVRVAFFLPLSLYPVPGINLSVTFLLLAMLPLFIACNTNVADGLSGRIVT